ncbi:hypothetical protein BJF81_15010 [Ornithinimicrobium sp. CNJ-824]|uniref:DUF3253 domain-containing protein n=1 Tax=Ornithinimicrobium sp. CNJ-824 TaxID=1904966 RepID=UPI000961D7B3|nr:DUF3253 domain-containing protein [Ornithinimicrobium sp. CNJ-824]OLT21707.1 hypothetical protein BJF81_15010 [Ornithinimicrobium sp. CNJ-824]
MRPRNETDDRPALAAVLVVVPARDEQDEIGGCLTSVAAAAAEVDLPVVVSVVLHRCTDRTAERVDEVVAAHPDVRWVVQDSDADSLGGARADGVEAGRSHGTLADLDPVTVWVASTDADSRVPHTWLRAQRDLADRGLDLVLGTVEPREDGSESARLWHAQHHLAEGHLGIHGANLGARLSAYDQAGGFPALDDGEDVQLVRAVRDGGMPWTSTDRTRVVTSSRRRGRAGKGFARFLRRLDDAVATFGATEELEERLRTEILRLAQERGPAKTLCPSEAAGAVDPTRRRTLTHVARAVACTLADEGVVVVTQKGVPVDGRTTPGPVRVGLVPEELRGPVEV